VSDVAAHFAGREVYVFEAASIRKVSTRHSPSPNSEGKFAMSVIYPLHFHRRVDRLWTLREKHQRSAPVFTAIDRRRGGRSECGRWIGVQAFRDIYTIAPKAGALKE
jgi:hypothetical protein